MADEASQVAYTVHRNKCITRSTKSGSFVCQLFFDANPFPFSEKRYKLCSMCVFLGPKVFISIASPNRAAQRVRVF